MDIELTPAQAAFIRQAVAGGRFECVEDAVTEALLLWEERERQRLDFLTSLDEAEASLDQCGGIVITQGSMQELASDVKRRGRACLAAERQAVSD